MPDFRARNSVVGTIGCDATNHVCALAQKANRCLEGFRAARRNPSLIIEVQVDFDWRESERNVTADQIRGSELPRVRDRNLNALMKAGHSDRSPNHQLRWREIRFAELCKATVF